MATLFVHRFPAEIVAPLVVELAMLRFCGLVEYSIWFVTLPRWAWLPAHTQNGIVIREGAVYTSSYVFLILASLLGSAGVGWSPEE